MKKYQFNKLNDEPLILDSEFVNEDDEESSLFFEFQDEHHYLDDIVSRNCPWFPTIPDLPDYIHGIDQTDYWNPLFVEIIDGIDYGEYEVAFNIYELEIIDDESLYCKESW